MICYCGLRHFYIHHFKPPQKDAYYILTHNGEIWDFSPELKTYGISRQLKPRTVFQLEKPVFSLPVDFSDFLIFSGDWHQFARQYSSELEPEYPHSWYLRFRQKSILEQFCLDFAKRAEQKAAGAIWGAGVSKLVAKLAAHNPGTGKRLIPSEQTSSFLEQLPLNRLPLPEAKHLRKLGLKTVGELAQLPTGELISQFGKKARLLQELGKGQDLVPFQAQEENNFCWKLDCTVLEGFLRPMSPAELRPHLRAGLEQLALLLQDQNKLTSLLKLKAWENQKDCLKIQRRLKEPTDDWQVMERVAQSLLPQKYLAAVEIRAEELKEGSFQQLSLFFQAAAPGPKLQELPARRGTVLPRRERLLLLWEEYFKNEQADQPTR